MSKITLTTIAKLGRGCVAWDDGVQGFGVRRQRRSASYFVKLSVSGRQRWITIGRHGRPWTPETARREAKRIIGLAESGGLESQPETQADWVPRYIEHARQTQRPSSVASLERYLGLARPLPRDRRSVAELLDRLRSERGPIAAARARSVLSSCFAWGIANGLCDANPVQGTLRPREESRSRVLSMRELIAVWHAAAGQGDFGRIVRLLILTGQRRNEVGDMRWAELGLEGEWRLPPERTKNGRAHFVPLVPMALAQLPERRSDFVWGLTEGWRNWSRPKAALDARSGVTGWTLHDLRRTAATGMAEAGVLPHVIEAVLNHVSGHRAGVAGVYNRARYEAEVRSALTQWADHVANIVGEAAARDRH